MEERISSIEDTIEETETLVKSKAKMFLTQKHLGNMKHYEKDQT